jgi:hypothetical protein
MLRVLLEEINEEILERMPEWFRVLRDAYEEKLSKLRS